MDGVDYSQGISFGYTLDFKSEDKYYADLIGFMHSKVGVNDIIETKTPISTPL